MLMGDNGSYGPDVRLPFNPILAKAYVYQVCVGGWGGREGGEASERASN